MSLSYKKVFIYTSYSKNALSKCVFGEEMIKKEKITRAFFVISVLVLSIFLVSCENNIGTIEENRRSPTSKESFQSPTINLEATVIKEDGYLIYVVKILNLEEETEMILPGLEIGTRFRADISYSSRDRMYMGKYEI